MLQWREFTKKMTPELFKKNLQPTSAESLTSHHTTSPNSPFYEFTTSICSEKVIKELIQLRRKKKLKKFTYLGFWMTKEVIMPWNWRLETKRRKIEPNLESKSVAFKKKKLAVDCRFSFAVVEDDLPVGDSAQD